MIFLSTIKMAQINCEVNLILSWSENCFIVAATAANQAPAFAVTNTKLYAPIVILSIQVNAKLLQQLKSRFKRTINWNKCQSEASIQRRNQYFAYLID